MTTEAAVKTMPNKVNGVDVDQINRFIERVDDDPSFAEMQFRASNEWIDGGANRTRIKEFYAGCEEDTTRAVPFELDSDEPKIIAGNDATPNPVVYVLHALIGCLTTTLVYHAAVRGIEIESVESNLEGDLDVRGLLGLSDEVRKSYHHVRVNMRVKSDACADDLRELAMFSPVYDMVSKSLPVAFNLETF